MRTLPYNIEIICTRCEKAEKC